MSTNYANIKTMNARLSESFGTTLANNKLGMTEEALSELVGRYVRGDKKGLLKGSITWLKTVKGGWVKTGGYNEGFVAKPNVSFAYIITNQSNEVVYTHKMVEYTNKKYDFEYHNDNTWFVNEYDDSVNKVRNFEVEQLEFIKQEPKLHICAYVKLIKDELIGDKFIWSFKGKYLNNVSVEEMLDIDTKPKWSVKSSVASVNDLKFTLNEIILFISVLTRKIGNTYNTKSDFDTLINITSV